MPAINDQICFLHIHKTGGTWARQAMREAGIDLKIPTIGDTADPATHLPISESLMWMGKRYCFTIIRDPAEWLRSYWCSREKESWGDLQGPTDIFRQCRAKSFSGFISNYLRKMPGMVGRVFNEYIWWKGYEVDAVGRLEDQPHALCRLLLDAGVHCDWDKIVNMPVKNPAKPEIARRARWMSGIKDQIYEAEVELCRRYGYGKYAEAKV